MAKEQCFFEFIDKVWAYYQKFGRTFTWRQYFHPYYILVSEIMLQQTQTFRVEPKFNQFIKKFPDFSALADASTVDLLSAWQGLGYNRRALALRTIAQTVMSDYKGKLPDEPQDLLVFKGIGPNTAGSICAFAFNKPTVFIETNIRAVYIHHFFHEDEMVHDKLLLPLIAKTLDKKQPRTWYYALMDYGVMLKKKYKNPAKKSKHHAKQSTFKGSDRQVRGKILRILTNSFQIDMMQLQELVNIEPQRLTKILNDLVDDGFIQYSSECISLKN